MRGGLVVDVVAVQSEGVEGRLEVDGVGQHDGVGDQGQAQGLLGLLGMVAAADVAFVGEEHPAAQRVQALPRRSSGPVRRRARGDRLVRTGR